MLQPGTLISGTYRVERLLGAGGMADVYEVSHVRLPRQFAVKVMRLDGQSDGDFVARFRQEAEILASLSHAHIVSIVDFGQLPDGNPYLVMELLQGEDLANFIRRAGPLTPAVALNICSQVGTALLAAHAAGVVHRDLKPSNIFLTKDGPFPNFVKILDFGIAKLQSRIGDSVTTNRQTLIGTPAYMAPEQALGYSERIDARTDQFALAAVLYEMIRGEPAFFRSGDSMLATLSRVIGEDPQPLAQPQIWNAVARALSKDPEQRYRTMKEFLAAVGATDESIYQSSPWQSSSQAGYVMLASPTLYAPTRAFSRICDVLTRNRKYALSLIFSTIIFFILLSFKHEIIDHLNSMTEGIFHHPILVMSVTFSIVVSFIVVQNRASIISFSDRYIRKFADKNKRPPAVGKPLSKSGPSMHVEVHSTQAHVPAWPGPPSRIHADAPEFRQPPADPVPAGALPFHIKLHGFEIKQELEDNGITKVYRGESSISFLVAVHVLKQDGCRDPDKLKRFLNSGHALKALNAISHPSLARFIALDRYVDGTPYMITEFYAGETLRGRLNKKGKLSQAEVVQIGIALADVLAACHEHGVVHRALSPNSVLVLEQSTRAKSSFGHIKLLGFSMVKLMEGHLVENVERVHTQLGKGVGVGVYMAPEQAAGSAELDGKADVFVLGMLLSELLLGKPVCEAIGIEQARFDYMISDIFPLFPNSQNPLENVIHMMTMRSPAARPTMSILHDKLLMISSTMNTGAVFPMRSIKEFSLASIPGRLGVKLSENNKSARHTPASMPASSAPNQRADVRVAEHMLVAPTESVIMALEASLGADLERSAQRRLIRNWLFALPEDEFCALYCDAFPELHKKSGSETKRHARITMILEHFDPEEAVAMIRSCLGRGPRAA